MGGERNNFIHCDCGDLRCMYESLEGKILGGHCVQESLLISHSHIYGVATDRFAKKKKKLERFTNLRVILAQGPC